MTTSPDTAPVPAPPPDAPDPGGPDDLVDDDLEYVELGGES